MILESFSLYLQAADPAVPASRVLVRWLWERLTFPAQTNVDRILRYEIAIERQPNELAPDGQSQSEPVEANFAFVTTTESGRNLLKSLYRYSMSYEQQRWARWVHCVKASDFNDLAGRE